MMNNTTLQHEMPHEPSSEPHVRQIRPSSAACLPWRSLREAMGLPEHYADGRSALIGQAMMLLQGSGAELLARIATDPLAAMEKRIAAGVCLSLAGDHRINPFSPSMVDIPGGCARIGSDPADLDRAATDLAGLGVKREWLEKECPAHETILRPFRIGLYPVTNVEYRVFLIESEFPELPTSWAHGMFDPSAANRPVYSVSARAAEQYAAWLSARTGRRFRLPTEAEWEYAAAGPDRLDYPWGNQFRPDCANTLEAGVISATPVGVFPQGASPFGALDMAGNVEEYVANNYAPYPGGRGVSDDLVLASEAAGERGLYRMTRGGCFSRRRDLARCRRRHGRFPSPLYAIGFRLAQDV